MFEEKKDTRIFLSEVTWNNLSKQRTLPLLVCCWPLTSSSSMRSTTGRIENPYFIGPSQCGGMKKRDLLVKKKTQPRNLSGIFCSLRMAGKGSAGGRNIVFFLIHKRIVSKTRVSSDKLPQRGGRKHVSMES